MSRINPYASIEKRSFQAALIHLLETEYRIVGSHRLLRLLAEDVERLVAEFYPAAQRLASGSLVWTCTADEGQKAQPGKPTEAYKAVTVALPLITADELADHTQPDRQRSSAQRSRERLKRQIRRLVLAAAEQGGLLTLAELSLILGVGYEPVRTCVREIEDETGQPLPLKGYKMDQGSRPTHKGDIIRLSEEGLEPPDIARLTHHSVKSVERYLKDYERVRMLLKQNLDCDQISAIIGRGKAVVQQYIAQARRFHPELFPSPTPQDS